MGSSQLRVAMDAALEERLARLHEERFAVLAQLPPATIEDAVVQGSLVRFTTLCVSEPDGSVMVFLRSDTTLGVLRTGSTRGFQVTPNGARRILTDAEVLDFFG